MNGNAPSSRTAFTMIEVLLAIAIFSGVLIAIYSCWSAVGRGARAGLGAAAEVQRSRIASRAVEESLLCAALYVENLQHYTFVADTSGQYAYLSMVSRLPRSFPGTGIFGDLAVRRVTFSVEPGPDQGYELVMTQAPILLETNQNQDAYSLVLAKNVSLFTLNFWDQTQGDWVDEWIYTNQLPRMVRFALGTQDPNAGRNAPEDYEVRVVSLPAIAVPQDIQRPQGPAGAAGGAGGGAKKGGGDQQKGGAGFQQGGGSQPGRGPGGGGATGFGPPQQGMQPDPRRKR
jgi:prepilin-type N-terminal cleavage/methylation domain-containing protein